jgi:4-aminobutyrate aminotransferase-like enzyme
MVCYASFRASYLAFCSDPQKFHARMTAPHSSNVTPDQLRQWDNDHVWHPFTPMSAWIDEYAPIIVRGEGFDLIDTDGRRYLDGISSLWCNVHGTRRCWVWQANRRSVLLARWLNARRRD